MNPTQDLLKQWLPIAAVSTALCALVYLCVQQALRHSANDPQIQLAEDAATALARGEPVEKVVPATTIDMAQSLAPFLTVFDAGGEPVAWAGVLHGKVRRPPAGVFDYVRRHGDERVTWQPESGVRMATVVIAYGGARPGFVMAARSLREVEKREAQVARQTGIAWLGILGGSFTLLVLEMFIFRQPSHHRTAPALP